MPDIDNNRRDFVKGAGAVAIGAALALKLPGIANAQSPSPMFDIDDQFARFMQGIGGTAQDAGGKVTFTGQDPIVRSHFRIASSMAIPAMGAAVGAAAIWKDRTGQVQDLAVDLRDSMYNVNPLMGIIMQFRMALGAVPANDAVARNFSFVPTVNNHWYQAPLAMGNPITFQVFPTKDGRYVTLTGAYPHLMDRILVLLKTGPERKAIATAISKWDSAELDAAMGPSRVIGGIHRTAAEWLQHPQGK